MNGRKNHSSASNETNLRVKKGIKSKHDGTQKTTRKRFVKKSQPISLDDLYLNVLKGSRRELARAITFIESIKREDQQHAQTLLQRLLPKTGESIRIGISGVPGAGKSTFIETFGYMLCEKGYRVAVLAIDPSSAVSGGSVLGDKTRMEKLANHPNAFIRPSPTSGTLGGVHRKTRETMLLCEAAGYDIVLIETVGVGQSETAVRNMVDFFILLALTGAGDDLQGMKKGIMETVDLIVVHKADGENERLANRTVREYKQILHLLRPATPEWETTAIPVSSYTGKGHQEVWEKVLVFQRKMKQNRYWEKRRQEQVRNWFHDMIHQRLMDDFFQQGENRRHLAQLEEKITSGELTVTTAIEQLFDSSSST